MNKLEPNPGISLLTILLLVASAILFSSCLPQSEHNILIVTGGHDFEREAFFQMFDEMPGIDYQELMHPDANHIYDSPRINAYDVLLFYDMAKEIEDAHKSAFIKLLEQGKGMVFLHHSLASYQTWDEFEKIIGGRYLESGPEQERSTYQHDVEFTVQVARKNHPVTRGLKDFVIHDEVYGNFKVLPGVQSLLTTTHPESGDVIGWTNQYGESRIVYLQLGHDHHAYENPDFLRLVRQAIDWVK